MNRRGFLSAILATGIAPAICKAENLMKLPSGIFLFQPSLITPFMSGEVLDNRTGLWTSFSVIQSENGLIRLVNDLMDTSNNFILIDSTINEVSMKGQRLRDLVFKDQPNDTFIKLTDCTIDFNRSKK